MFASRIAHDSQCGRAGPLLFLERGFFFASGSDRIFESDSRFRPVFGRPGDASVSAPLNETHARAIALPLAGCPAGILECDMVAGAVPACAYSFRRFGRPACFSAHCRGTALFIWLIRIAHKSSPLNRKYTYQD